MALVDTLEATLDKVSSTFEVIMRKADQVMPLALEMIRKDKTVSPAFVIMLDLQARTIHRHLEENGPTIPYLERYRLIIRNYRLLETAGPKYCFVDFKSLEGQLGPDSIGPQPDDWESSSTALYRQITEAIPTKLQNQADAVQQICGILRSLLASIDALMLSYAWGAAGIIVALIGAGFAIQGVWAAVATGSAIPVAIATLSLYVALVGVVVALLSFRAIGDANAAIMEAARQVDTIRVSVGKAHWPTIKSISGGQVTWA